MQTILALNINMTFVVIMAENNFSITHLRCLNSSDKTVRCLVISQKKIEFIDFEKLLRDNITLVSQLT